MAVLIIRTKRQYTELAQAGLAGNCPKTWNSVDEFLEQSSDELVGIRCYSAASSNFRAFVPRDKVWQTVKDLGLKQGEYYLSVTIPPSEVIVAGELSWMDGRWVFYHSYLQCPMREALREGGRHAYGYFAVWGALRRYCTPQDVEDLQELFERYTHEGNYPVIELTVTRHDCGIFPGRNTLIWEVRHY